MGSKIWYEKNKERWLEYNADRRQRLNEWYQSIKSKLKCLHCGDSNDLEFHHPDPLLKEYNISDMVVRGYARQRILDEMAKCIPLCDYCHESFTYGTSTDEVKTSG